MMKTMRAYIEENRDMLVEETGAAQDSAVG
jgi:hypothetical protein